MAWFKATQVTATQGSNIVTVVSGESIASVQPSDALIIGGQDPVEINRAYVDGGSNQLIELVDNWAPTTQTTVGATVLPTAGDFKTATDALKDATQITSDNIAALDAWVTETSGTVAMTNLAGTTFNVKPVQVLESELEVIGSSAQAMTKQDFDALSEKRIRDNAGSGFTEWGKHYSSASTIDRVNEGLQCRAYGNENTNWVNRIDIGRVDDTSIGISRSDEALVIVNGVQLKLSGGNSAFGASLKLPDAPDGLDKTDGTGRHASLAAAIVAGGTSLTESVITRQDFVFLEVWHEKISDKDWWCPNGSVQYTGSYTGVTLNDTTIDQGYSAVHEDDTTTVGKGAVWSTLSDEDKAAVLQDHNSNIYSDDGELIQVRWRLRAIKGLGDDWYSAGYFGTQTTASFIAYDDVNLNAIKPRGGLTTVVDLDDRSGAISGAPDGGYTSATYTSLENGLPQENGMYTANHGTTSSAFTGAHNGLCFAVPIALVQRRNQGAYHPVYNSEGTNVFLDIDGSVNRRDWHINTAKEPSSTADCFDLDIAANNTAGNVSPFGANDRGNIDSGNTGRPDEKYYDAIYVSDVQDLRMSSKRLPLNEIRERAKRKGIAGEMRGFESVPFSTFYASTTIDNQLVSSSSFVFNMTTLVTPASGDEQDPDGVSTGTRGIGYLYNATNGNIIRATKIADNGGVSQVRCGEDFAAQQGYTTIASFSTVGDTVYIILEEVQTAKSASPTWADIIGDPANIATTFPNGVEGQWIPVIPNGAIDDFNLSRKSIDSATLDSIYTEDDGATWSATSATIDTSGNYLTWSNHLSARVSLNRYSTQAHFTEDTVNSEVLSYGDVTVTGHRLDAHLPSTLIGKVAISTSSDQYHQSVPLTNVGISANSFNTVTSRQPRHGTDASILSANATGEPTVKFLDYLSHESGQLYLNYLYKEMIWDTDFGDNNQFEVADNQNIQTDDNGNEIKYGTARVALPYFYMEEL